MNGFGRPFESSGRNGFCLPRTMSSRTGWGWTVSETSMTTRGHTSGFFGNLLGIIRLPWPMRLGAMAGFGVRGFPISP